MTEGKSDSETSIITGVILAGGKSKRMGNDKATLRIGESILIESPIKTLGPIFRKVIVVTNKKLNSELRTFLNRYKNIMIVNDIYVNHGALGGIYTAMCHADTPYVFVSACDMPFLNGDFIVYMSELIKKNPTDVLIPVSSGGLETLHAIYNTGLKALIKRNMLANNNKIKSFFPEVSVTVISTETVKVFDPEEKIFKNINTPDELKTLLS